MLDNDCWAMEIISRNFERDKRVSRRSQYTHESENYSNSNGGGCVPVKNYFAFLIHVANELQLSSIYLLIACFDERKIFLRI